MKENVYYPNNRSHFSFLIFYIQEELKCKLDKYYQTSRVQQDPPLARPVVVPPQGPPPPPMGMMAAQRLPIVGGPPRGMPPRPGGPPLGPNPPGLPPVPPPGMPPPGMSKLLFWTCVYVYIYTSPSSRFFLIHPLLSKFWILFSALKF